MNRIKRFRVHRAFAVDGLTEQIEYATETFFTHRDSDGSACVNRLHAANQAVGRLHGNRAHNAIPEVLGHFDNQVDSLFLVLNRYRMVYLWQIFGKKLHIYHRSNDLDNLAYIHFILLT